MRKLILVLFVSLSLVLFACNNSSNSEEETTITAQTGDTVKVEYTSSFQDWNILEDATVVQYTIWENEIMPIITKSILWQEEWFTTQVTASSWDAYGMYYDNENIQKISKSVFNENLTDLSIWANIKLSDDMEWVILDNSLNIITVDLNPRETKEPMDFEIKLLSITKATNWDTK